LRQFDLEVVGSDHPGIVRDVFKALAQVSVNVEELSTRAYSAPDSGGILFEAKARLAACSKVDREKIRNHLEKIALDVLVDIRLRG
jgi:glycine cleavage system regulatory protein